VHRSAVTWKVAASAVMVASVVTFYSMRSSAASPPQFGSLSNFDVFNDTGQPTHGFEIELDGITASQITYEFGAPYQRYGNPILKSFSGGVDVLYESPYDAASKQFTAATPLAPAVITPTGGHVCWTGGSANYPTAGCEHFGVGLSATPTNVSYYWLVADPKHAGSLVTLGGGVQLPAPSWSATPAPPGPNSKPVVAAAIAAPQPELGQQLGNAVWVKVFYIESTSAASLGHLVTGDKAVPNIPSQVETEWSLIQAGAGGGLPQDLTESLQMGSKSESVTRRFEFYKYAGPYDPSSHEATPVNDAAPSAGELGRLIGTQMGAFNLAPGGKVPGDHTAPRVIVTSKPAATTKLRTARILFHATDPDSRVFTYFCSLDAKIPATCKSTQSLSGLKLGRHTLKIYAADAARNASAAVTVTWTITK